MNREPYRQYKLVSGSTELVCWLKHESALRAGVRLTLKGDERAWTVVERYEPPLDRPPLTEWQVGGLL